MKTLTSTIYGTFLTVLLSTNLMADCSYELFSISSAKNTKIIDFVEQLSDECEFTVIVTDPNADEFLNKTINKTHIKNMTINEVLELVLTSNNLSYTLENDVLKISYLTTKVFSIDYILSQRISEGITDVTLSSSTDAKASGTTATAQEGSTSSESGMVITTNDEVKFWEELDLEFQHVLNRPHDSYVATAPIINKNAGLVTVTSTVHQMKRFEDYLKQLQDKVQLQVLIDVKILSVTMSENQSTGVDWAQLYALQNISLSADILARKNVATFTPLGAITTATDAVANPTQLLQVSAEASLNEVIKFLKTQGDVNAISNPKVLTLNNQPALITVGTEHFYKITSSDTLAGGTTATTTQDDEVKSVFAGVLLDITPEIADDRTITLKINPSISETTTDISGQDNSDRTMPPDLSRRQLSSVVTVKDGNRIILGGLINTRNTIDSNQVPLLGSIPVVGWLFKYEEKIKSTQELIIIIEPHIINKEKSTLSLQDLGYKGLDETLLKKDTSVAEKTVSIDVK